MTCCTHTKAAPCGCCEGTRPLTPLDTANRPGLSTMSYRVGTHATFLETMLSRLSDLKFPELRGLKVREGDDTSIALLDAWATVADVLTFYQERIANEGYLATATERRSIMELARLVGYQLRPGLAANAFLAFELEKDMQVEIPPGTRVQSLPGPGELPQSFETYELLKADYNFNIIKPRLSKTHKLMWIRSGQKYDLKIHIIYINGILANLKLNSPFLLVLKDPSGIEHYEFRRVLSADIDNENKRTKVTFQVSEQNKKSIEFYDFYIKNFTNYHIPDNDDLVIEILDSLKNSKFDFSKFKINNFIKQAIVENKCNVVNWLESMKAEAIRLGLDVVESGNNTNLTPEVSEFVLPPDNMKISASTINNISSNKMHFNNAIDRVRDSLELILTKSIQKTESNINSDLFNRIWRNNYGNFFKPVPTPRIEPSLRVYSLRLNTQLFGHNAQKIMDSNQPINTWNDWPIEQEDLNKIIFLDGAHEQIIPDSFLVLQSSNNKFFFKVKDVFIKSICKYGINGKTTEITLKENHNLFNKNDKLSSLREFAVYAQSELLPLAEEPILDDIANERIELDNYYDDLAAGRLIIISGERTDICVNGDSVLGYLDAEPALIKAVQYSTENASKQYTVITLTAPLLYRYKRDTVKIYANIVKASQGETRKEILGSGDGSLQSQSFTLKQPPLTFISAPTPAGTESTLEIRVNGIQWHESESFFNFKPVDRTFITRQDEQGKTTVTFGDGCNGARLPTGIENITAVYRKGIGKSGNVKAGQISLLATRPLGIKGVNNPLPALGGVDPESRELARRNATLSCMALDRLVSVQDYEDFVRAYAGIAKASAVLLTDGDRRLIHITVAGIDNAPIEVGSDLYQNLSLSLHTYGDPFLPIQIDNFKPLALVVDAGIRINRDYDWVKVEQKIRQTLLSVFSFEQRELGQSVAASELLGIIQNIDGVDFVDLDAFYSLSGSDITDMDNMNTNQLTEFFKNKKNNRNYIQVSKAKIRNTTGQISPAQIALLFPAIPETLILRPL